MNGKVKMYYRWAFLELDHEIGKYYRSLFKKSFGIKLQRPSNDEHITIISEYDNLILENYKFLDDKVCLFELDNILYTNQNAFWLNVLSDDLVKLRNLVGLGNPNFDLHFCIGYLDNCTI